MWALRTGHPLSPPQLPAADYRYGAASGCEFASFSSVGGAARPCSSSTKGKVGTGMPYLPTARR